MTRMMCLRLLRGVRSEHASEDAMSALITPLFTLCNPGVALCLSYIGLGLGLDLGANPNLYGQCC